MKKPTRLALSLVLLALLLLGTASAADHACSVTPVELRCEYLNDPLGIDVTEPRLSWQLTVSYTHLTLPTKRIV